MKRHKFRSGADLTRHDCSTGRIGYTSVQSARLAVSKMTKRARAYLCDECRYWHVTASSLIARPDRLIQSASRHPYRRSRESDE